MVVVHILHLVSAWRYAPSYLQLETDWHARRGALMPQGVNHKANWAPKKDSPEARLIPSLPHLKWEQGSEYRDSERSLYADFSL